MLFSVLFSLSVFACSFSLKQEDLAGNFCKQFPNLHLCHLHDTLQGSLTELEYLLQDAAEVASPMMEKRKSAFVRFGKRSANEDMEMEKRKSAFVRFGRSVPEMPDKRKSQYIRFGRK